MNQERAPGTIITFYSYKGGTGRSMALANIAWILASNRYRVLVLDWDLEAPGLHRYFRPFLLDKALTASDGIIDFVSAFAAEAIKPLETGQHLLEDWYVPYADILSYAISLDWEFPEGGRLDFIPAGRQVSAYATRVSSFNWQNFYERLGGEWFIEAAKARMRAEYDYILVDSRTGVSDTAGICTVQLPDILVACFTYNNQSLEGAAAVTESVYLQRSGKTGGKGDCEFRVFPVPMRVDPGSNEKLNRRKQYARSLFDAFLNHISASMRETYWNRVEVPYIYDFSYEESLATFQDSPTDPKRVLAAMLRIANYLTGQTLSDLYLLMLSSKREEVLAKFEGLESDAGDDRIASAYTADLDEQIRLAEFVLSRLSIEEERAARQLWTRLVRIASTGEIRGNIPINLQDLDDAVKDVAEFFTNAGLLVVNANELTGENRVRVADENIARNWTRLHKWIRRDLEFLIWRQKLEGWIENWKDGGGTKDLLLNKLRLRTATGFLDEHRIDLNLLERSYIDSSARHDREQDSRWLRQIGAGALVCLVLLALWALDIFRRSNEQQKFLRSQAVSLNEKASDRLSAGEYVCAIDLYDAALSVDPAYVDGYDNRGNGYLRIVPPDFDRAIADFKRCTDLDSANLRCSLDLGNAYNQRGDYDSALKCIQPIIDRGERNESILNDIQSGKIKEGQVPVDRGFINKFETIKGEIYYTRGNSQLNKGDNGAAISSYSQAIVAEPEYGNAYLMRSVAYSRDNKPQQAISDYDAGVRLPHDAHPESIAKNLINKAQEPPR